MSAGGRTPGWQQPARPRTAACMHIGAIFAALAAPAHDAGHEWLCTCGKVYVVRQRVVDGQTVKRLEAVR